MFTIDKMKGYKYLFGMSTYILVILRVEKRILFTQIPH